ncbi:motilin-like isoform X2 [Betta splendens]|uniref:Motilin-like isoform X2 n=1 Tax=Betta splendens TaxID=158456 RepID=A0A8M1HEF9_BETSP|nr:motilin-like isoform X2 [Betta splendens]
MRMHSSVAGCVVVVWLLAARSEGHITFFSPKEMMLMKEREGRKEIEPQVEDAQSEDVSVQQLPPVDDGGNPVSVSDKTMDEVQLDLVTSVLKDIIHDMADQHQKAK